MQYMVMVTVPFGVDDTYECEYSGIVHNSLVKATIELSKAKNEYDVLSARIERIERR